MAKQPSSKTVPSPTTGNEISNPEMLVGSDPMHLHQTMLEVQKELTTNTAVLNRAVTDIAKQGDKIDGLLISFSWFKGVFAATAALMIVFAAAVWWLIGSQISDLKNELLRRIPASNASMDSKK